VGITVARLREAVAALGEDVEVLVVDDWSPDGTAEEAAAAGARVLRLDGNRGKGAAVRAGVLAARGRSVVFTDADLAYPPEQVGAVLAALEEAELDLTGVTLADGSGLSRQNQVPAAVLADLLGGAADGSLPGAGAVLSGLPVAGYDGTLFDRGDDDPATAPGTVRAKTGTLNGVHSLAGTVVTADGRLLAFAVLADAATGGEAAAEDALDEVAAELARCGCS
jgi:D-alanyl-D-alanine carboxypeptidase/D-alanyl-D-alanine-endopeptidase (penicillin-binding protein 4)